MISKPIIMLYKCSFLFANNAVPIILFQIDFHTTSLLCYMQSIYGKYDTRQQSAKSKGIGES